MKQADYFLAYNCSDRPSPRGEGDGGGTFGMLFRFDYFHPLNRVNHGSDKWKRLGHFIMNYQS